MNGPTASGEQITPQEKLAYQVIDSAIEGDTLAKTLFTDAVKRAEAALIHLNQNYAIQAPDEQGKMHQCTLATYPGGAKAVSVLLAITTYSCLVGPQPGGYHVSPGDLLNITSLFIQRSNYEPDPQFPFSHEQLREANASLLTEEEK